MKREEAVRRLTDERGELRRRLSSMSDDLAAIAAAAVDSNVDDEHDPEGATIAFEREQLAALRDQAVQDLAEVDAALHRVEAGAYGTCEVCGQQVADERLTALPATRTCIRCAARRR